MMYYPTLLALITTLLGVSSHSSAFPAILIPPSFTTLLTSTSRTLHHTSEYSHSIATFRSTANDDIIVFPNNNFEAGCNFIAQGKVYDLCPLLYPGRHAESDSTRYDRMWSKEKGKERAKERNIEVLFVGTRGVKASEINVCPERTEMCFIGSQTRATSIRRDELTGPSETGVYSTSFESEGRKFDLWLKSEERDIRITFKCTEEDEVIYDGIMYDVVPKETHVLWHTPHACPIEVVEGLTETKVEDKKPVADGGENDVKEDELLKGGISRGWISFMVILIVLTLIIMTIVISSPQTRHYLLAQLQSAGYAILPLLQNLKLVTRPFSKHIPRFRVTESRLVHWAQEDMVLNGDEDFMVNGSGKGVQGWNEYIPLKSSPIFYGSGSSQVASWSYSTYGSVPFEALDVDESEVGMPRKPKGGVKELIRSASERTSLKVKGLLRR